MRKGGREGGREEAERGEDDDTLAVFDEGRQVEAELPEVTAGEKLRNLWEKIATSAFRKLEVEKAKQGSKMEKERQSK